MTFPATEETNTEVRKGAQTMTPRQLNGNFTKARKTTRHTVCTKWQDEDASAQVLFHLG